MSRCAIIGVLSLSCLSCSTQRDTPSTNLSLLGTTTVIDPGHGGKHYGGRGYGGLLEKNVNLSVALRLQSILESLGARVVMTRSMDQELSLDLDDDVVRRVEVVNSVRPDLLLSLHTNYCSSMVPRGFEVWVPKGGTSRGRASRELAECIRQELGSLWGSGDRGTKENSLRLLHDTTCPSVLVEMEFITNSAAEVQLSKRGTHALLAEHLAQAVVKWRNLRGSHSKTP